MSSNNQGVRDRLLIRRSNSENPQWNSILTQSSSLTPVDESTTICHRAQTLCGPDLSYIAAAMTHGESDLAGLAGALIGKRKDLTAAECRLLSNARPPQLRALTEIKRRIRAGEDVLGSEFCRLRSRAQRRDLGATYTPNPIVDVMIAWARAEPIRPMRIVDPGSGSGRFLMAAAASFPRAQLIGIDVDPLATLILRANATVLEFSHRLRVELCDYREFVLPRIDGPTLFVGNPPYVRHHRIGKKWKQWFAATAARYGLKASKLAGLHIHFFLKTREIAQPGDIGVFITAAEWLDVNYGSVLRHMLADGLGGTSIHVICPRAHPFDDAMSTGAITCFRVGNRPDKFSVRAVHRLSDLKPLNRGRAVTWSAVQSTSRWSTLVEGRTVRSEGEIELGELFRVHRGQVTGANAVWIVSEESPKVPTRYLFPTVTRAREIFAANEALTDARHLRRVVDLPLDLDALDVEDRRMIEQFLKWAKERRAHESYIARHRRAWWAVGLREPPPILCTYMARRPPSFALNLVGAHHLNVAHGLYPLEPMSEVQLRAVLNYLQKTVSVRDGRTYAGGLVKFEPGEVERLRIPEITRLAERPIA